MPSTAIKNLLSDISFYLLSIVLVFIKGMISERGIARIFTIPTWQWGERCLLVNIKASASFTLSIAGELMEQDTKGPIIPWYRERQYPTEPTE